jgi:sigma-B regulation protein RsbQ
MSVLRRNNVKVSGRGVRPMVFAHGFGCDQHMWRWVAPAFEDSHRLVLFDHVGAGKSDLAAYDRRKYGTLAGYAEDVLAICAELELEDAIFVGHSVSAMIGVLAAVREPRRFTHLVLVGPSPRYINAEGYVGGFTRAEIDQLLDFLATNPLGWAQAMAPVIMGPQASPVPAQELADSICRTDPAIAMDFARVTFLSDNRADLAQVQVPALVLQCRDDAIAPLAVGEYVHRHLAGSQLLVLDAIGHCPHMSAPQQTIAAIRAYLAPQGTPPHP